MAPAAAARPRLGVGVISDTHGLLRPQALEALGGDRIVHAGDLGDPAVLDALASMAPVTAVRGNIDRGGWAGRLPEAVTLVVGGFACTSCTTSPHSTRRLTCRRCTW